MKADFTSIKSVSLDSSFEALHLRTPSLLLCRSVTAKTDRLPYPVEVEFDLNNSIRYSGVVLRGPLPTDD